MPTGDPPESLFPSFEAAPSQGHASHLGGKADLCHLAQLPVVFRSHISEDRLTRLSDGPHGPIAEVKDGGRTYPDDRRFRASSDPA